MKGAESNEFSPEKQLGIAWGITSKLCGYHQIPPSQNWLNFKILIERSRWYFVEQRTSSRYNYAVQGYYLA